MNEAATKLPAEAEKKGAEAVETPRDWRSLEGLRREVDRLFEDFPWVPWRLPFARTPFDLEAFWRTGTKLGAVPAVDVAEKDNAYEITAELPGMEASDIEVKFTSGVLKIAGEKQEEKEEKKKDYYVSERRYGSFQRSFRIPDEVDADKIEAAFSNGVLKITLPKKPEAKKAEKSIAVKAA